MPLQIQTLSSSKKWLPVAYLGSNAQGISRKSKDAHKKIIKFMKSPTLGRSMRLFLRHGHFSNQYLTNT